MAEFYPAAVIRKMYCNLKMHSKHSSCCSEEILDLYTQMYKDDIDCYILFDVIQLLNLLKKSFHRLLFS